MIKKLAIALILITVLSVAKSFIVTMDEDSKAWASNFEIDEPGYPTYIVVMNILNDRVSKIFPHYHKGDGPLIIAGRSLKNIVGKGDIIVINSDGKHPRVSIEPKDIILAGAANIAKHECLHPCCAE